MKLINRTLLGLSLVLTAACGGGGGGSSTPPPPPTKTIADTLNYSDPSPSADGYRFVKNTTLSTKTHLVLDLLGAAGTSGRGVAFVLVSDSSRVAWTPVNSGDTLAVDKGTTFNVSGSNPILTAKVSGTTLQAGLFQKGTTVAAATYTATGALARVALDLQANTPVNTTITVSATKANTLPAAPDAPKAISIALSQVLAQ